MRPSAKPVRSIWLCLRSNLSLVLEAPAVVEAEALEFAQQDMESVEVLAADALESTEPAVLETTAVEVVEAI